MQYARRKEESLLKTVLGKCITRKRSLGRPRPRWDDGVTEDVKKIKPRVDWKEISLDREKWKKICWTAYGLKSCSYERIRKRRRLLRYAILYVRESPTNEIKNKHYYQKSKFWQNEFLIFLFLAFILIFFHHFFFQLFN